MTCSGDTNSFAEQLKRLRKEKTLKQKELASSLGVSQSTIANYEQGIRFPDERMLKDLASFLEVSSDELIGYPGPTTGGTGLTNAKEEEFLQDRYFRQLYDGEPLQALDGVLCALNNGVSALHLFTGIIEPALIALGGLWEQGEIDAAQEHLYTEEIERHLGIITYFSPKKTNNGLRCAAAAAGGEMHSVGLRMICYLLEIEGWETFYLGTNTPPRELAGLCIEKDVHILAVSTTMDYHINSLKSLIEAVRSEPRSAGMKILAGGGALNRDPALCGFIGADACAHNAASALEQADRLTLSPPPPD